MLSSGVILISDLVFQPNVFQRNGEIGKATMCQELICKGKGVDDKTGIISPKWEAI